MLPKFGALFFFIANLFLVMLGIIIGLALTMAGCGGLVAWGVALVPLIVANIYFHSKGLIDS